MVAVVILMAVVLVLVVAVLIGLLRTHAEVLRRLHELGAGLNAPARSTDEIDLRERVADGVAPPRSAAQGGGVFDLSGVTPSGSAIAVSPQGAGRLSLLAFLSSGCSTCADFWRAFGEGAAVVVKDRGVARPLIVTKGVSHEIPAAVATLAPPNVTVVMSDEAWRDYSVPASPYFVLIDGAQGVIGEGSAASFQQLIGVLDRAAADTAGAGEESRIDADLRRAGITPGHASLYEWTAESPVPGPVEGPARP